MRRLKVGVDVDDGNRGPLFLVSIIPNQITLLQADGRECACAIADGSTRTIEVDVVSDTGFHFGTGLYFGLDGHHHGNGAASSR